MSSREELDHRYQDECDRWPDRKVEIINGRIVVREMPTIGHACAIYQLLVQILLVATGRGWKTLSGVKIFLGPQADRYEPDLIVVPADPRRWDDSHVYAADTLLVVETVSPSSTHDDHVVKPGHCADAGVPLYLVIDTFQQIARLLSDPGEQGYHTEVEVPFGKPLDLPEPWRLTLDTGKFIESLSAEPSGVGRGEEDNKARRH
jgi:Uma2 family endonuclease